MKIDVSAIDLSDSDEQKKFSIEVPKKCPYCGIRSQIRVHTSYFIQRNQNNRWQSLVSSIRRDYFELFVVSQCEECQRPFISKYEMRRRLNVMEYLPAKLIDTYPTYHATVSHHEKIVQLSPRFVKTLNEALHAEESNLYEICGMGYRKALEILIKDFAIKMHPESKTDIEGKMLGQCIGMYIDNPMIKSLAKASSWIGNDMTHYLVNHPDCSVETLKDFIRSVETIILSELEVLDAEKLISDWSNQS